jgi:hypothetical protein
MSRIPNTGYKNKTSHLKVGPKKTYVVLRQVVVELCPEVDIRQVFVILEGLAEGGELLAEAALRHRRIQRSNGGRHPGGQSRRLAMSALPLQPVLRLYSKSLGEKKYL